MANPTLTVADITVNQGDEYIFVAGDFTGADGDGDFDHYRVTTLPTKGTLYLDGVALVVNDEFDEADLTAGKLVYAHDGVAGTDDSMATKAVDAADNLSASAATTTITVTDGSWLLSYIAAGIPPVATRFSLKSVADAQAARLEAAVGGDTTVVFLPAAVVSGLPLNYFHSIDLTISSLPLVTSRHTDEIERQAAKLLKVLNYSANSDLKTLVDTWGSALELEAAGRATLDEEAASRWRNIRQECEAVPATFQRAIPVQRWWEVLDRVQTLIP